MCECRFLLLTLQNQWSASRGNYTVKENAFTAVYGILASISDIFEQQSIRPTVPADPTIGILETSVMGEFASRRVSGCAHQILLQVDPRAMSIQQLHLVA